MSAFRAFRSGGRVDNRGVFDFEDEFGQDPIRSRYANTTMARDDSESRVQLAASEMELAKASLEAMTEPARQTAAFLEDLNKAAKAKSDMMKSSRVNAQAIKLREQLDSAKDYASLTALRANPEYAEAFENEENEARYNAQLLGEETRALAVLKHRLPQAVGQNEVDSLFNEYSWLAGNDEAQKLFSTFTPVAKRREAAMKGLMEAGAQAMPVTPTGELDVDRAERALAGTYTSQDVRSLQGTASNLTRQLDNIDDPESPEAANLQEQLNAVNRQLGNAAMQQESGALRAQAEGQSLGIGQKAGWQTPFIFGEQANKGGDAAAAVPETESASKPDEPKAVVEKSAEEQQENNKTEPYKPQNRREIGKRELELQRAREEAGLTEQPPGIRTVNEALAAQNAPVREKAASLEEARERINPYEKADANNAQTIQDALSVVYPRLANGGFDVGDAEDPRVVSAAEFLQRVDPSLLRMIASSPSRTGSRAGLSLEEITELAARARPSARGRRASN